MKIAFCLDCDRQLDLGSVPQVGQRVKCQNCEVEFEIINLRPLELDWVYDGPATSWSLLDEGWGLSLPIASQLE